jgi:hypothetical protein
MWRQKSQLPVKKSSLFNCQFDFIRMQGWLPLGLCRGGRTAQRREGNDQADVWCEGRH